MWGVDEGNDVAATHTNIDLLSAGAGVAAGAEPPDDAHLGPGLGERLGERVRKWGR